MEETNYNRTSIVDQETEQLGDGTENNETTKETPSHEDIENVSSPAKKKKTYLQKLKPISRSGFTKKGNILDMAWRPFVFLTFPVIFYAGFTYGSYLVWFLVLNGTTSLIFANPPYNFKASNVGLVYIAPLIGTRCAYVVPAHIFMIHS